jgi:hypothetical protein
MAFPWEFTIPVPGPWQERQSSAAKSDVAFTEKAKTIADKTQILTNARLFPLGWIEPCIRCTLRCGFTVGLFAGSDWGKMRMFWTEKGYFMTLRQFSPASPFTVAVQVPQNSTPAESLVDISPMPQGW